MPTREEHVKHCEELYGYGFEEIHRWMDGTVNFRGPNHRVDRHDPDDTPALAYAIFEDKIPDGEEKFIKDAVLEHIRQDVAESRGEEESKDRSHEEGEREKPLVMCSNCGEGIRSESSQHEVTIVENHGGVTSEICADCMLEITRNKTKFSESEGPRCMVCGDRYDPTKQKAEYLATAEESYEVRYRICRECWSRIGNIKEVGLGEDEYMGHLETPKDGEKVLILNDLAEQS
ncbi:hypothetical protein AKJ41_00705 [candidate division MSBL1 archaeon SCGC-AAA259O05]|uniref:Uncharacterized protein n=1 Tax=candidate division MSBL1 archaeon SCGC-AAA259O05 TaxID=1698271 RepID=A0A133V5F2_9EURY|nr:hypothetical protein AKJ41_00705 [candidate division MSBL1 archaeon SCGC-AAA259O05]